MNSTVKNQSRMIYRQAWFAMLVSIFCLALGAIGMAQESAVAPSTAPPPAATSPAVDLTRAQLIEQIKNLGGIVKTAGDAPDGAIVEITFVYTHHATTCPAGTVVPPYGVTDDLVGQFAKLPTLRHLELNMCPHVTDAGVKFLKGMTQLQQLSLSATKVTDVGMAELVGLTQLQWLRLGSTKITDKSMAYLEGMTQLQTLMIAETPIGNAGMVHLKGLTQLTEITLYGNQVSDAGVEELRVLTNLKSLRVNGHVSTEETKRFKEALPNCRIWR